MRRSFAIAVLASLFLAVLLPVTATPVYDSRMDINGDGKIDLKDVYAVSRLFGAATTPQLAPENFTNVVSGGRYWMTGGDDSYHAYKGVDSYCISAIPGAPGSWWPTFAVALWHTHDWTIYHVITNNTGFLEAVNLTLRNLQTPVNGTNVSVWVWNGTYGGVPTQSHDTDLGPLFQKIGIVTIIPPGDWKAYYLVTPAPVKAALGPRSEFYIAVRLDYGEIGPGGTDRNAEICWVKLYV